MRFPQVQVVFLFFQVIHSFIVDIYTKPHFNFIIPKDADAIPSQYKKGLYRSVFSLFDRKDGPSLLQQQQQQHYRDKAA